MKLAKTSKIISMIVARNVFSYVKIKNNFELLVWLHLFERTNPIQLLNTVILDYYSKGMGEWPEAHNNGAEPAVHIRKAASPTTIRIKTTCQ